MRGKIDKPFPGQETGVIKILFKNTDTEDSVQLRFDIKFDESIANNR